MDRLATSRSLNHMQYTQSRLLGDRRITAQAASLIVAGTLLFVPTLLQFRADEPVSEVVLAGTVLVIWAGVLYAWISGGVDAAASRTEAKFMLMALALHGLFAIGLYYVDRDYWGQSMLRAFDAGLYDRVGQQMATAWHGSSISPSLPESVGPAYFYFVAFCYYLFDNSVLAAIMCNCGLAALTVVLGMRIARIAYGNSAVRPAGWLMALYPPLFIYSGMLLKDSLLIALVSIIAYLLIRWRWTPSSLFMLAVATVVLARLRLESLGLLVVAYFVAVALRRVSGISRFSIKFVLLMCAGAVTMVLTALLLDRSSVSLLVRLGIRRPSTASEWVAFRSYLTGAPGALTQIFLGANLFSAPRIMLLAVIVAMIFPFAPILGGNGLVAISAFADWAWVFVLPGVVVGAYVTLKRNSRIGQFAVAALLLTCIGSAVATYGLIARYRDHIVILSLVLAVGGFRETARMRFILPLYIIGNVLLLLGYMYMKTS